MNVYDPDGINTLLQSFMKHIWVEENPPNVSSTVKKNACFLIPQILLENLLSSQFCCQKKNCLKLEQSRVEKVDRNCT